MVETIAHCPMIEISECSVGYIRQCAGDPNRMNRMARIGNAATTDLADEMIKVGNEWEREHGTSYLGRKKWHCIDVQFPRIVLKILPRQNRRHDCNVANAQNERIWYKANRDRDRDAGIDGNHYDSIIDFAKELTENSKDLLHQVRLGGACKLQPPFGWRIMKRDSPFEDFELYYTYKEDWRLRSVSDMKRGESVKEGPWTICHKFYEFWQLFIDAWNRHLEPKICDRFLRKDKRLVKENRKEARAKSLFENRRNADRYFCRCRIRINCNSFETYLDDLIETDGEGEGEEGDGDGEQETSKYHYHWIATDIFLDEKDLENALKRQKEVQFDPCNRYEDEYEYPDVYDFPAREEIFD